MHRDWFILTLLLPTPTISFTLDRKRWSHEGVKRKWKRQRSDSSDYDSVELMTAYDSQPQLKEYSNSVFILFFQTSEANGEKKAQMTKFVAVWENRFLENVKLCSESIPGEIEKKNTHT